MPSISLGEKEAFIWLLCCEN